MRCWYFAFDPAGELLGGNMHAPGECLNTARDAGGLDQHARAVHRLYAHPAIVGKRWRLAYRAPCRRCVALRRKLATDAATGVSRQPGGTARPPPPAAPASPAKRKRSASAGRPPKWHYLYFVLAALDLIAVCAGLYLSHSIMSIYERSVAPPSRPAFSRSRDPPRASRTRRCPAR